MKDKLTWVLVLIAFCAIFGLLLYFSAKDLVKSIKAGKWPTVDGVIKSSQIESKPHGEDGNTYEAKITYAYEVNGLTYTGNNIAFGYESGSRRRYEDAKAVIDHIGDAKIVVVRYDPSDPQISTLSFGAHKTVMFDLAYAFFEFIIVTIVLFAIFFIPNSRDSE